MAHHSFTLSPPLLCLRGWLPKGEGDEDPQIKEGNKENKVKGINSKWTVEKLNSVSHKARWLSYYPENLVHWSILNKSFLVIFFTCFQVLPLAVLKYFKFTCKFGCASSSVLVLSPLQPKSGGGGRRRGGQRHKGKSQTSSTISTAAPSSSGIGGCWTALLSPVNLPLCYHSTKCLHSTNHEGYRYLEQDTLLTLTPCLFTPGLIVFVVVFLKREH